MAGAMDLSERRIVENTLCTLIHKHGISLYREDSALRFCALINDALGTRYSRYRKLLILAVHERIPSRLLERKDKSQMMFLKTLEDRFSRDYDIKSNTAQEIIEILSTGLNNNKNRQNVSKSEEDNSMFFRRHYFVRPFAILFVMLLFSLAVRNSVDYDISSQASSNTEGKASPQIELPEQAEPQQEIEEKPLTQGEIRKAINDYNAGSYKTAIPVLQRAAGQQHAEAAFYYGQALRYGRGIKADLASAIRNLDIAQRGGFVQAANSIGIVYRDSIGGPEGRRTAYEYFRAGAGSVPPDPFATYNYACCLAEGYACDVNVEEAITYLQKGINYCYWNTLSYPQSVIDGLREDFVVKLISVMDDNYQFVNIESVAVYLTKCVYRPYDRLYLCTRWLTENIAYDTEKKIRTVEGAFKNHKGVCEAYAKCLNRMLETIDISCEIIDGNWKGNSGHSWNVVWIDRPIYIDATWAAGFVDSNNVYVKAYDSTWFDTPYDEFKVKHIPG